MAKERIKRFNKALVIWLRTSADLVALAEFNAVSNLSINIATGEDNLKTPSCNVFNVSTGPFLSDVDKGINETLVRCVLRHISESSILEMPAAIEDLAAQVNTDGSKTDASFSGTGLETTGIQYLGAEGSDNIGASTERVSKGVLEARILIRILWREV